MNYILFDDARRDELLPLTFLRPVADIRVGIVTIREKWEHFLGKETSTLTEQYLSKKYPLRKEENNILINGSLIPSPELVKQISSLKPNQALVKDDCILAMYLTSDEIDDVGGAACEEVPYDDEITCVRNLWDIFTLNVEIIKLDYSWLTEGRKSQPFSESSRITGKGDIFIEEGARIDGAMINASAGPVYIGKNSQIMEGSVIRGPFAMCEHAVVKMGSRIYGGTTFGPWVKVGGEVSNSVIFGYSNKAHDGFLGNSVIAEWCNLGADTNISNLKNNYSDVRLWNYHEQSFISTGLQFCGMIMGDYSKTGISTMINTGTVIGVNVNIYGSGFQRNFIPSFTWGSTTGFKRFDLDLAFQMAERMFKRRNREFTETDRELLADVNEMSFAYRRI